MPGLTAKVLRTHHACKAFEGALQRLRPKGARKSTTALGDDEEEVGGVVATAYAHVAALCNHRVARTGAKQSFDERDQEAAADSFRTLQAAKQTMTKQAVGRLVRRATLSPSTTRSNYVDPRIPVAFCKRHLRKQEAPCDVMKVALSSPSDIKKFSWASSTPASFVWDASHSRDSG